MSIQSNPDTPVEYVPCELCSAQDSRQLPRFYTFRGHECFHVRCRNCGLIYVNPRPKPEYLKDIYPPEYFLGGGFVGGLGENHNTARYNSVIELIRPFLKEGSRLLEIGCADGPFLARTKDAGWRVTGVELSEFASQAARTKRNLEVYTGTLEQANFPQETFDCIFMGDVIEHLLSPRKTLCEVLRILIPGGIAVIVVPVFYNTVYARISHSYLTMRRALTGRAHQMEGDPHHLFEFTPWTLKELLKSCGFEIYKAEYESSPEIFQRLKSRLPSKFQDFNSGRALMIAQKRG